ncbi:hypothetical protein ACFE04_019646 [Oxalis oulophora]
MAYGLVTAMVILATLLRWSVHMVVNCCLPRNPDSKPSLSAIQQEPSDLLFIRLESLERTRILLPSSRTECRQLVLQSGFWLLVGSSSWIGSKLSRKLAKSDSLERACKSKIWSSLSLSANTLLAGLPFLASKLYFQLREIELIGLASGLDSDLSWRTDEDLLLYAKGDERNRQVEGASEDLLTYSTRKEMKRAEGRAPFGFWEPWDDENDRTEALAELTCLLDSFAGFPTHFTRLRRKPKRAVRGAAFYYHGRGYAKATLAESIEAKATSSWPSF